ncbi:hypothetical protein [Pacificibacter maritimus]|uniref:hypothetical protein n=1 Tax=Pacificibacter maritimus TaxID=762213 RepID=UPI0014759DA7|nr:hypothetical protein [Pacificibacter maritimus]
MLLSTLGAKDRIAALLAGRAAEKVVFGEALNGAGQGQNSDLELATKLAGQMTYEWGLGDQLVYDPIEAQTVSRTTAKYLDKTLRTQQLRAIQILEGRKELVATIATALCKNRELSGDQIRKFLRTEESPTNTA